MKVGTIEILVKIENYYFITSRKFEDRRRKYITSDFRLLTLTKKMKFK